jgi:hypothetical protein
MQGRRSCDFVTWERYALTWAENRSTISRWGDGHRNASGVTRARRELERAAAAKAGRLPIYRLQLQLERTIRMLEIFHNKLKHGTTVGLLGQGKVAQLTQEDLRFLVRNMEGWSDIIKAMGRSEWAIGALQRMLELPQPKPKLLAGSDPRARVSRAAKHAAKRKTLTAQAPRSTRN